MLVLCETAKCLRQHSQLTMTMHRDDLLYLCSTELNRTFRMQATQ